MFKKNKKRQARVEISFKHGNSISGREAPPPKEVIEILPGQEFRTGISTDSLWEGDTLIKEFDWLAGFSRIYEYFYR